MATETVGPFVNQSTLATFQVSGPGCRDLDTDMQQSIFFMEMLCPGESTSGVQMAIVGGKNEMFCTTLPDPLRFGPIQYKRSALEATIPVSWYSNFPCGQLPISPEVRAEKCISNCLDAFTRWPDDSGREF